MTALLGQKARITIDSITQGNVRMKTCKSSKVSDGRSVDTKNSMSEDDPVGFVIKPGAQTLTLDVFALQGDPEVDFFALKDASEVFGVFREIVGGAEAHYPACMVSKIDEDDDEDGNHMLSVEIIGLSREPMS